MVEVESQIKTSFGKVTERVRKFSFFFLFFMLQVVYSIILNIIFDYKILNIIFDYKTKVIESDKDLIVL